MENLTYITKHIAIFATGYFIGTMIAGSFVGFKIWDVIAPLVALLFWTIYLTCYIVMSDTNRKN